MMSLETRAPQKAPQTIADSAHIQVRNIRKSYLVKQGFFAKKKTLHAISDVSFTIESGGTFGLVGESGSGKSTLAKLLLGAENATSGTIRIGKLVPVTHNMAAQKQFHRAVQPVLQDPYSSLSPLQRIAHIIDEPLRLHERLGKEARHERVLALLEMVGLRADIAQRYPHELSGGQRQRVAIARALSINPEVLILDEPVSALDVSVQAQVLNLLKDLQAQHHLTYVMISHDLAVVAHMSTQIGVLYLGEFMELGRRDEIVGSARHPYTQALIASGNTHITEHAASGEIPSPIDLPQGCRFQSRCPHVTARCKTDAPKLRAVSATHWIACHVDIAPLSMTGA